MKKEHGMKKGDSKFFKDSKALIKWAESHKLKDNEFALQCGQGKDENGYNVVKG